MASRPRLVTMLIALAFVAAACVEGADSEIAALRERVEELETSAQTTTAPGPAELVVPIDVAAILIPSNDSTTTSVGPTTTLYTTTTTVAPLDYVALSDDQELRFLGAIGINGTPLRNDPMGGGYEMYAELVSSGYMLASDEITPELASGLLGGIARANDESFAQGLDRASAHLDGTLAAGWINICASDERLRAEDLGYCISSLVADAARERSGKERNHARSGEDNPSLRHWWCAAAKIAIDEEWTPSRFATELRMALPLDASVFPDIAAALPPNIWSFGFDPYPHQPDDLPMEDYWYPYSIESAARHARQLGDTMTETSCLFSAHPSEYPGLPEFISTVAHYLQS